MIYLDYAASTPISNSVLEIMKPWFLDYYANPSSSHKMGIKAQDMIEGVRVSISDIVGCYPSEVVFTSGATESNNLAIKGTALEFSHKGKHIITSKIEHKCILNICHYLESIGFEVTYLDPNRNGIIEASEVAKHIRTDTTLVTIQHVNNELGTIMPIRAIGALCVDQGVRFHTDAAQSFGKIDLDLDDDNLDLISISAHKIYGPKGIGALIIRDAKSTNITPVIHGAGQELGLRGGTLASPLIAGFGACLENLPDSRDTFRLTELKQLFINRLRLKIPFTLNGELDQSISSIVNITLREARKGLLIDSGTLMISNGSACASRSIEISHVHKALGLSYDEGLRSCRISFGLQTTSDHVIKAVDYITELSA